MKKNTTKTTTKKVAAKATKASKPKQIAVFQTGADLKSALLVVSLTINLFVFCIWLVLQITSRYDEALHSFFILR